MQRKFFLYISISVYATEVFPQHFHQCLRSGSFSFTFSSVSTQRKFFLYISISVYAAEVFPLHFHQCLLSRKFFLYIFISVYPVGSFSFAFSSVSTHWKFFLYIFISVYASEVFPLHFHQCLRERKFPVYAVFSSRDMVDFILKIPIEMGTKNCKVPHTLGEKITLWVFHFENSIACPYKNSRSGNHNEWKVPR